MLHAQSIEETVDLIKYVSSVSSRGNARTNDTTKISISNQILKEEIFLASFPCLNPYVVHLILSEYNLYEFLNTTVEECCKILHSVPERFLKCFYSTAQRAVTSTQPNKYEDLFKSFDDSAIEALDSNGLNQNFQLKPFVENLDILQRYDKYEMEQKCQDLFDRKNFDELTEIGAQYSGQSMTLAQMKHPEISLQEIDLDYMSLKLSDKYDECSQSSSDEHVYKTDSMSCHSSNIFTLSPREELKERSDSQSMYKELSHPISSIKSSYFDEIDYTEQQNGIAHSSLIKRENELDSSSSILESSAGFLSQNSLPPDKKLSFSSKQFLYTPRKRKNEIDYLDQQDGAVYSSLIERGNELNLSSNILKSSAEFISSQSSLCPDEKLFFNFEQFLYTPRKKKSHEFSESNIDISPPHLKKTCGIQKGRTSKTVTKQDFRSCNSPLKCQEILSYHSQNNKNLKSCPTVNMNNCYRSYH